MVRYSCYCAQLPCLRLRGSRSCTSTKYAHTLDPGLTFTTFLWVTIRCFYKLQDLENPLIKSNLPGTTLIVLLGLQPTALSATLASPPTIIFNHPEIYREPTLKAPSARQAIVLLELPQQINLLKTINRLARKSFHHKNPFPLILQVMSPIYYLYYQPKQHTSAVTTPISYHNTITDLSPFYFHPNRPNTKIL